MTSPQDEQGSSEPRPAGPVAGQGSPAHPPETPDPTPPAGGASAGDAEGSVGGAAKPDAGREVEADLDRLLSERDEYLDLAKRTKADFENFRKRMAAEQEAAFLRGKADLAGGLIKVLDTLELALDAAGIDPSADQAPDEPMAQGVLLTYRQLCEAMKQVGVESYDPGGQKFDPSWHEGLQKVKADGTDPGTVVEVLQKGYRLDGQVLRAARVVVSE